MFDSARERTNAAKLVGEWYLLCISHVSNAQISHDDSPRANCLTPHLCMRVDRSRTRRDSGAMSPPANLDPFQSSSFKMLTGSRSTIQSRQTRPKAARLWYSERVDDEAALVRSMADNPSLFVWRRGRESSWYQTCCRLCCGQWVNIEGIWRSSRERTTQQGTYVRVKRDRPGSQ